MEKIKISKLAFIPLAIFVVNFTIYLLIKVYEVVYIYSSVAKRTYIYICFPMNVLGFIITIYFVVNFLIYKKSFWNVILCLPLMAFIFYFYFVPLIWGN